jgi:hypothetical protein
MMLIDRAVNLLSAKAPAQRSGRAVLEISGLVVGVVFILTMAHAHWREATAPFVVMQFQGAQVELVEDMAAMCGPNKTPGSGSMSVLVDYYAATASGRTFQMTQFRHERCDAEGCPTRLFITNPEGGRRLVVNAKLPIADLNDRSNASATFRISRDSRTLHHRDRTFPIDGL